LTHHYLGSVEPFCLFQTPSPKLIFSVITSPSILIPFSSLTLVFLLHLFPHPIAPIITTMCVSPFPCYLISLCCLFSRITCVVLCFCQTHYSPLIPSLTTYLPLPLALVTSPLPEPFPCGFFFVPLPLPVSTANEVDFRVNLVDFFPAPLWPPSFSFLFFLVLSLCPLE